jgi:integration host factor subunit beta
MTRVRLIAELAASHPHLRPADVELIVASVFEQIARALASGYRVELLWRLYHRAARGTRTGDEVPVEAKSVPAFRAGGELRARPAAGRGIRAG